MPGAQVAVADYTPNWWPAATRLLIRRVRLDVAAGAVIRIEKNRIAGEQVGALAGFGVDRPRQNEV